MVALDKTVDAKTTVVIEVDKLLLLAVLYETGRVTVDT